MLGAYVTAVAGSRATHFSFVLDACREAFHWAWDALELGQRAINVATLVVRSVEPRKERMSDLAKSNFSTATDLADTLVRETDLSFRDAHHLVGAVVRSAAGRSLTADQIDAGLIREQALLVLGRPIEIAPEVVARSVDPAQAVQARRSMGGPSPSDMDVMLAGLEQRWGHDRDLVESRKQQLVDAEVRLDAAFVKLASRTS